MKLGTVSLLSWALVTSTGCLSDLNSFKAVTPTPTENSSQSNDEVPGPISVVEPTPGTSPAPGRDPASVEEPLPFDRLFSELSYKTALAVDDYYSTYRELLPQRNAQEASYTDKCDPNLDGQDRFADRISYAVSQKMNLTKPQLGYVASSYRLPANVSSHASVSLISHPLCNVDSSTLNATLNGRSIPPAATIAKAQRFIQKQNAYRQQFLNGDPNGKIESQKLWTKMFMCLSYVEGLTTADSGSSQRVGQSYAPSGYRKPAGVNFYEDSLQPAASRLNIGLFQFTPTASGNIQACIREWNVVYPQCSISTSVSQSDMIRVVGSSLQTFNSFCAVSKVTGMFSVQLNTSNSGSTHPANSTGSGLKPAANRCVSLHFLAGKSYNHFGPFQNSVGNNLDKLMSCTMKDE